MHANASDCCSDRKRTHINAGDHIQRHTYKHTNTHAVIIRIGERKIEKKQGKTERMREISRDGTENKGGKVVRKRENGSEKRSHDSVILLMNP